MAKDGDTGEPLIEFFKTANIHAVHRVLERARKNADRAASRQASAARKVGSGGHGTLTRAMNKAMAAYGRASKNRPSIRQTAPDTGGRPYHFGYSTVTRGEKAGGQKAKGGTAPKATPKAPGRNKGRPEARTREAAHQIYTERDGALETNARDVADTVLDTGPQRGSHGRDGMDGSPTLEDQGPQLEAGRSPAGPEQDRGQARSREREDPDTSRTPGARAREWVETGMAEDAGLSPRSSPAAAQAYMENPAKLPPNLKGTTASFGTIGDTLEERMAFWDLVHDHERPNGGRTQSRLVLELPHEATPRDRHEIVRRFTNDFTSKGIPFWASIHAPTGENDGRNFHAHVVFTDRPMRRMRHPETGDLVWDFTIAEKYKTSSRNTMTRYPHRQRRDPEIRERGWVKSSRARFSNIVNEVMVESGNAVRYDPRSYRDMGLQVAPMRNVTRILADKIGKRAFVVMDADWTRKMIDAEIEAAAVRRDATFTKLQKVELEMQAAARNTQAAARTNARLPRSMRLSPGRVIARAVATKAMDAILATRRDRLATRLVDEATLSALKHVADATAPTKRAGRPIRVHDPATAPDQEALAALHSAALEEVAEHAASARTRSSRLRAREEVLTRQWKGEPSPATKPPHSSSPADQSVGGGQTRAGRSPPATPLHPEPPAVIRMPGPAGTWKPQETQRSAQATSVTQRVLRVLDEDVLAPAPASPSVGRAGSVRPPWMPTFAPGSLAASIEASTRLHAKMLLDAATTHGGPPGDAIRAAHASMIAAAIKRREDATQQPQAPTTATPVRMGDNRGQPKGTTPTDKTAKTDEIPSPARSEAARFLKRQGRSPPSKAAAAAREIANRRQTLPGPRVDATPAPTPERMPAQPSTPEPRVQQPMPDRVPTWSRDGRQPIPESPTSDRHQNPEAPTRTTTPTAREPDAMPSESTEADDPDVHPDNMDTEQRRRRRRAILARRRNRGVGF